MKEGGDLMVFRTEWLSAENRKVLVVNDLDSERENAEKTLRDVLGTGWTVVSCKAYEPAIEYLRGNPDFFAALCDQRILLGGSGPDAGTARSEYGDRLIREAAEISESTGLPQLLAQWTSNGVERVSEGPNRACPIFRCKCGASLFPALLLRWLELVEGAEQRRDMIALVASDNDLSRWLERGKKAWITAGEQDSTALFLRSMHDCRHDALSPYLAIWNDIQSIDFWRGPDFRQSDSRERIDAAVDRIATNARRVQLTGMLPQIGGLLDVNITLSEGRELTVRAYLESDAPGTQDPVVIDDGYITPSDCRSPRQALQEALRADESLREVCGDLANCDGGTESVLGEVSSGRKFEKHFEELRQSLETIVQFFEAQYGDAQ